MCEIELHQVSNLDSHCIFLPYYKSFLKTKSTIKDKFLLRTQKMINSPGF